MVFCDQGTIFLLNKQTRKLAYALDLADYDKNGPKYLAGSFIDVNCNKKVMAAIKYSGVYPLVGQQPPQSEEVFDLHDIMRKTNTDGSVTYNVMNRYEQRRGNISLKLIEDLLVY